MCNYLNFLILDVKNTVSGSMEDTVIDNFLQFLHFLGALSMQVICRKQTTRQQKCPYEYK